MPPVGSIDHFRPSQRSTSARNEPECLISDPLVPTAKHALADAHDTAARYAPLLGLGAGWTDHLEPPAPSAAPATKNPDTRAAPAASHPTLRRPAGPVLNAMTRITDLQVRAPGPHTPNGSRRRKLRPLRQDGIAVRRMLIQARLRIERPAPYS